MALGTRGGVSRERLTVRLGSAWGVARGGRQRPVSRALPQALAVVPIGGEPLGIHKLILKRIELGQERLG